ncbi:hypothetical protein E4U17_002615 [Claviceps sp. LM77 group G4]|nr:hypothetical protein E4U17_002615 [Claviceps sp. LM77 group G4]
MARTISCLATLLAARNAFVQAKPVPDERPLPTLDVRPIKVVTELEVSLSTSFPAPTNLVFCHGETLSISQAGFLSTVTTITHTQNASITSFAPCGTMAPDQMVPSSTCDCSAFATGLMAGPMGPMGPMGPPGPPGPACTTIYAGGPGAGAGACGAGAGGSGSSAGSSGGGGGGGSGSGSGSGAGGAGSGAGDAGAGAGGAGGAGNGNGNAGFIAGGGGNNGNNGNGGNGGDSNSALATELDPIVSSIVNELSTLLPTGTGAVPTEVLPIVSSLIGDLSTLFPTGIPTTILPTATGVNSSVPLPTEVESVVSNLPSSLPPGQLSSIISELNSIVTNILPTNTIPNLPTCAPGNPVCATPPEACRKIGDISDINAATQLPIQVAECTAALGPFAEDFYVGICLGNVAQGPTNLLACVTNALSDVCITSLPGACTNLLGEPADQLATAAPQCALALGPFLVDDANKCLTGTLTSGDAAVSCLEKSLGLSACVPTASGKSTGVGNLATETGVLPLPSEVQSILNQVTTLLPTLPTLPTLPVQSIETVVDGVTTLIPSLPVSVPVAEISSIIGDIASVISNVLPTNTLPSLATCTPGPPVCATVPDACEAIGNIGGLTAAIELPAQIAKCTTSLGALATNPAAAACLANVVQGPTAIVNCLRTSLEGVCITELPAACTNLAGAPSTELVTDAPQCALALGPFLVNDAQNCLNVLESGPDVIACLQKQIGLAACPVTPSPIGWIWIGDKLLKTALRASFQSGSSKA